LLFSELTDFLHDVYEDPSLFGFASIDAALAERTKCKCALVTLVPHPKLDYDYNAVEFHDMMEELRKVHSGKLNKVKTFLDANGVSYAAPPASPADDGNYLAEFSYKWAAIHAGLGFVGKNDVFVHYKFAQRVRISCLLIDFSALCFSGEVHSECGQCDSCVQACPHGYIQGNTWNINTRREKMLDYKSCATKSKHSGEGKKYLCARCSLACRYPVITD
jgi:epoxyqueuosine reductase QueG